LQNDEDDGDETESKTTKKERKESNGAKKKEGKAYTVTDYVRDRLLDGDADLDASDAVRGGGGGSLP
jgi:hypothetical protein